jgi:arsenate reductase (thioredoxin)
MSQALFERVAEGRHESQSAGTRPAQMVHPVVVDAMQEVGIDLSQHRPQKLTDDLAQWADLVVTMGCGDECPYIPGKRYLDWELSDPDGKPIGEVRKTRDEIGRRVADLKVMLDSR